MSSWEFKTHLSDISRWNKIFLTITCFWALLILTSPLMLDEGETGDLSGRGIPRTGRHRYCHHALRRQPFIPGDLGQDQGHAGIRAHLHRRGCHPRPLSGLPRGQAARQFR